VTGIDTRGFFMRHALRVVVAVVCLSVLLAGLVTPQASFAAHRDTVAATQAATAMPGHCDHDGDKSSPDHRAPAGCDGCLNCVTLATAVQDVAVDRAPSASYVISVARLPASHSIIPPSPPPKTTVQL
jgi:hypothetical protein